MFPKRRTKHVSGELTDNSPSYTLKTGTAVEDEDPILKLLRGVSHPEIQLGVGI